mgnify:CR=1 FL=1
MNAPSYTTCPRSSDPFHIVTCYIWWFTSSRTHSNMFFLSRAAKNTALRIQRYFFTMENMFFFHFFLFFSLAWNNQFLAYWIIRIQKKALTNAFESLFCPWHVYYMLLKSMKESRYFLRKNIQFVTALDLIKCLEQIKYQRLHLTCAPISELPSSIITVWLRRYLHFFSWPA